MKKSNELTLDTATISNDPVETATAVKTYTASERNWYLVGLAGQNVIYNIIGAALAYYLQFTLLIPAITVSIIMAAARVWDAFNDPMMGTIVDRTRSKWGKCRPYLMIVPIPIMIITIACFTNFGFYGEGIVSNSLIVFWAAFTYVLWGMIYTLGDIPLWGVTSLMTESEKDKTKILSLARVAGGIGGGLTLLSIQPIALALGSMFTNSPLANGNAAIGEKYGFLAAAIIFAIIGTALFLPLGFKIKENITSKGEKYSLADNFKIAVKNKPFMQIITSGILSSTKMLIALAAMPLVTYYFSSKNALLALLYMALLGGGMFIGQFIAMAFTPKLLTKFSTKNLYNWSNILGVIPYILIFVAYLLAPSGLTNFGWVMVCFVLFAICGGSAGVTTVLQSTMIANAVDYEDYVNHRRPDGVFFSGQTFVTKLQSGIATILSGVAYTIVGFSDSRVQELNAYITAGGSPRMVGEYGSFMMILFLIVSILPAIGCLLAVIPTWHYCLDDDDHKRILAVLRARRAADLRGETLTEEEESQILALDESIIEKYENIIDKKSKKSCADSPIKKSENVEEVKEISVKTKDTEVKGSNEKEDVTEKKVAPKKTTKKPVNKK